LAITTLQMPPANASIARHLQAWYRGLDRARADGSPGADDLGMLREDHLPGDIGFNPLGLNQTHDPDELFAFK
jgi:hypothetical protein